MKSITEQDQQRMFLLAKLIYKYIGAENKLAMKELFEIDFIRKEYSKNTVYNYLVLSKQLIKTGTKAKSLPTNFANYILKMAGKPEIQEQPKATVEVASKPVEETLEQKIDKLIKEGETLNGKYVVASAKLDKELEEAKRKKEALQKAYMLEADRIGNSLNELYAQQAKELLV